MDALGGYFFVFSLLSRRFSMLNSWMVVLNIPCLVVIYNSSSVSVALLFSRSIFSANYSPGVPG